MNMDFIILNIPIILFALTIHEYCHALAAHSLGDDTAKRLGRLTLNPIKHLDIFGTILMVLVGFGWAKPVPVDARKLSDPKRDMLYVALAGPLSNLILAVLGGFGLRFMTNGTIQSGFTGFYGVIFQLLILTVLYNTALAVFNMIPLPPLDGSRVLFGLLPRRLEYSYRKIEPFGILILFAIFMFGHGVFNKVLWYPVSVITRNLSGINLIG